MELWWATEEMKLFNFWQIVFVLESGWDFWWWFYFTNPFGFWFKWLCDESNVKTSSPTKSPYKFNSSFENLPENAETHCLDKWYLNSERLARDNFRIWATKNDIFFYYHINKCRRRISFILRSYSTFEIVYLLNRNSFCNRWFIFCVSNWKSWRKKQKAIKFRWTCHDFEALFNVQWIDAFYWSGLLLLSMMMLWVFWISYNFDFQNLSSVYNDNWLI